MNKKFFTLSYHMMLAPGIILLILFSVVPMTGVIMAFQDFNPGKGIWGSDWVGFDNFKLLFQVSDFTRVIYNTLFIASMKIIASLIVPVVFALLLNEVRNKGIKRFIQTGVYLPHFVSWVILAGVLRFFLAYDGIVNHVIQKLGIEPILFFGSNKWFPAILISSDVWKEFGFGAIIYLAAIAGLNVNLYEAAMLDGANRWQQTWHITLPGISSTMVLLLTLSLGSILNAGFDQIFNMYNPVVYESSDILDTFVYRVGLLNIDYSLATAVGLLKSFVSMALIIISYAMASKFANYRIF